MLRTRTFEPISRNQPLYADRLLNSRTFVTLVIETPGWSAPTGVRLSICASVAPQLAQNRAFVVMLAVPHFGQIVSAETIRAARAQLSRILNTFSISGSTTSVLLRFLRAVSGSFKPWPVSVQTATEPGLSPPLAPYLSRPATEAAEAGSAKIPCPAISR